MKNIIVLIIMITGLSFGQNTDSIKTYNLGEIEVTAERDEKLNSVEVTETNFLRQNSFTVFDALQYCPGIYSSISGKNEAQLSIRGFDQRQISVMIDGAPVYIPYDGSFDLNAIQLAGFNKISVSKNTPSIVYGPNSMGGSINLVSANPVKNFSARLNYQNGSSQNMNLGFNGTLSGFYYNAALGYSNSNGFRLSENFSKAVNEDGGIRNNSRFKSKAGIIKIGTKAIKNVDIAFSFNHIENEKDVPVHIHTSNPRYWRYNDWNKSLANFMFNSVISPDIIFKGNIFYEKFMNVLDSYDDDTYTSQEKKYAFHSVYDDYSYGINFSSYISIDFLPLTKIIFLYKRDTHKEQGDYDLPFQKYQSEIRTAGIEEEFLIVKNLKTIAGISYDRMNPVFAEDAPLRPASSSINGNIGLSYNLNNDMNIYFNASRKTRFPTLKEFYSELLGSYKANHQLAPEQNTGYEIGISRSLNNFSAGLTVFYNDVKDLIQIVSLGDNVRQYQNVNEAQLYGTEVEFKYNFSFVYTALNYTYLSARNITDDEALPNRPEHTFNFLLNKNYESGFEWNTEASFISSQYSFDSDSRELKTLPNYLLLNARIAQKIFSNYTLYVRVNNITDKYYETEYGFPQPGREYFIGIVAEW